jgi:tetratricopeptide (TPR) repeat protein
MAFWDFEDNRYKGARALLIASILGVLVTAFGLTLLFWSYDESPSDPLAVAPTPEPTPTPPPSPEEIRLAELKELRIELGSAVNVRDGAKMESLALAILEIEPGDSGAWSHVGYAEENREEFTEALESYGKAIAFNPNEPYYRYLRARLHRKLGDFPAAIRDLEEASRTDPASVGMANLLLIYKIQAGEVEQVRRIVDTYEQAQIHEQAGLWLLGAAALSLQDGNLKRAAHYIQAFHHIAGSPILAELLSDSFFDPYRDEVALHPYL